MTNVPNVNPISDKVKGKAKEKSGVRFPASRVDTELVLRCPHLMHRGLISILDSIDSSPFHPLLNTVPKIVGFSLLKHQEKWIFRNIRSQYGLYLPSNLVTCLLTQTNIVDLRGCSIHEEKNFFIKSKETDRI